MTTLFAQSLTATSAAGFGLKTLKTAMAVHGQRRKLNSLTSRELMDIGITTEQAQAEVNRSFWDYAR